MLPALYIWTRGKGPTINRQEFMKHFEVSNVKRVIGSGLSCTDQLQKTQTHRNRCGIGSGRASYEHPEDYLGQRVDVRAENLETVCIASKFVWYVEYDISSCRCTPMSASALFRSGFQAVMAFRRSTNRPSSMVVSPHVYVPDYSSGVCGCYCP